MSVDRFTQEEIGAALGNVATGIQVHGMTRGRGYIDQNLEPGTHAIFRACAADSRGRLPAHHRCAEVDQALLNCLIVGTMIGVHAQRAREAQA